MKTVAIYCRVSTDAHGLEATTLEIQLERCRKYCQELDYQVVHQVSELLEKKDYKF